MSPTQWYLYRFAATTRFFAIFSCLGVLNFCFFPQKMTCYKKIKFFVDMIYQNTIHEIIGPDEADIKISGEYSSCRPPYELPVYM